MNAAQREAVRYLDGPSLVLAGAGSGKTRVITGKIAYLIRTCGYSARKVVAVTFTNKAALEMQGRLSALLQKPQMRGLTVSTFHSFGVRFLREEYAAAGLKKGFSVLDSQDCLGLIQSLIATTDRARLKAVQQRISLWKNALVTPDQAAHLADSPQALEAVQTYHSYQATLRAYQSVDFDDLILLPCQVLAESEDVRQKWQHRMGYLLVDEYQDTNQCQYQLLKHLTGPRAMFTAVGDDDQAIYGWRGATIENLARLQQDFPALRLIKLEQNYRSTQRILTAANHVIASNPKLFEKKLWSEHGTGESITVTRMDGELAEAQSVAMRLSAARVEKQAHWRDFAVLYRSNQQARVMEQALRDLRIPYTVSGGQSFFDKAEVRDVLAYLRLLANDADDPAFIRAVTTPRRGIGQATLQAIGQYASQRDLSMRQACSEQGLSAVLPARQYEALSGFIGFIARFEARAAKPPHQEPVERLLDELMAAIGYENHLYDVASDDRAAQSRWQTVLDLLDWLKGRAQESDWSLVELVQHVALVTMLDRQTDEAPDAVTLSTLHASKGLEFPHVFLIGVEEGLLPHMGKSAADELASDIALEAGRIEEERRLMYVGITRAQRSLHLTWCARRRRQREERLCEVSRFVAEMGLE
ncbi:MAG: UvrD-helicase domain-containing protein, partial [Orrella sp.]